MCQFKVFTKSKSWSSIKVALEIAICLPWKKFVLPDPLAPTAQNKKSKPYTIDVTKKYNQDALI
jgi:hypothetical protein